MGQRLLDRKALQGPGLMPQRMTQILMSLHWHLSIVAFQVALKNTVTAHQTRRLWGQRLPVEYGGWPTC